MYAIYSHVFETRH